MNRVTRLALTAASVVVAGVGAFLITQAVTDAEAAQEPWVVPLSSPTSSIDLDPDGPALDALVAATDELGLEFDFTDVVDDGTGEPPSDDELREALGLFDDEPVPDDVTFPWGAAALAPNVDLTARGLGRPEPSDADTPSWGVDTEPIPADDSVWEDVDPAMPFVARELDDDELPTDDGDAEGELGDPEELDELLFRYWGTNWDGLSVVDDVPLLQFHTPDEPDFLDVCAATIDDVPVDCGDGISATVMPLVPDLEIIAVAIDNGRRCEGLEEGDGLPVRITFNRPISQGTVGWVGTSDVAVHTRHQLVPDRYRVARFHATQNLARVYHHCMRLPTDPQSRRYTARIEAWGEIMDRDTGSQRAVRTVEVSRPPSTEGRPPTSLEPLGDRRLLAHVPAHRDGTVTAHVIVRDPSERGLGSQCDPDQLTADTTDWGRWAGPGEPVRIRPAHRGRAPASTSLDPAYDRILTYDLSFRSTDLDEPTPTFELCLTWLQGSAGSRHVVERENHLISPPTRPIVDVFIDGGGTSVADTGIGPGSPYAMVDVRQLTEAANGTSLRAEAGRIIVHEADLCSLHVHRDQLAQATTTPRHLCRFEMTDDRTEVLIGTVLGRRAPDGTEFDHARLVPLPGHPSHPSRPAGCSTRCADTHIAYGWMSRAGFESGGRPDAQVNLRFVVTGDAHEPWLTLPLLSEEVRPDQPALNVGATTLELWDDDPVRGIDLTYSADRPVRARFVGRPSSSGREGTPPPGCPAPSVPHVVEGDAFEQHATLSIRDACALTHYRFALELTDEDGNRAVYGDLLSWLVATRTGADLLAGDDAYVASSWRPRLRTRGHQWEIATDVQVYITVADRLQGGVSVGEAVGPSVSAPEPTGSVHDMTSEEVSVAASYSRGRNQFLQRLEIQVGDATMVHGREGGDGRRCLNPVARHGPKGRYVEVGDVVPIRAEGHMEHRRAGCGVHLLGDTLYGTPRLRMPPWADSPTASTTYLVPADVLAETGEATLVLHNREQVCSFWTGTWPRPCHPSHVPDTQEAVVTLRVIPDRPPSRTLIGEF